MSEPLENIPEQEDEIAPAEVVAHSDDSEDLPCFAAFGES